MANRKITALAELTAPVGADQFAVIDMSEAADSDARNKRITYTSFLNNIPQGTVGSPQLRFTGDNTTGFYRPAANQLGFSCSGAEIGKFSSTGFQLGAGTAAAQLHLFSTDTTDQVIIENTDAGADTAPDLVLYRNSASPAASDNLGNIEFRGEDDAGNTHNYAQVSAGISSAADGSENGILDLMSSASGTTAARIRLSGANVGIGQTTPDKPLHLTTALTSTALELECTADDSASGGDLTIFHRRGASSAGQDDDLLGTVFFRGKNDAGVPEEIDYASVQGSIADASDGTENGTLRLRVETAGTLETQLEIEGNTIGFFGATAAGQVAHVADINTTATSGALPAADDTNTIADAASPTNAELLQYCVTLEAKVEALLAFASAHGLMASS